MQYIKENETIHLYFNTINQSFAPAAPDAAFVVGDFNVYKDGSAVERTSSAGYTIASPFDSTVGLHALSIDTSNNTDAGFWEIGSLYQVVFDTPRTVDSVSISGIAVPNGKFTIRPEYESVDLISISGQNDTLANFRDMYNGTGYTDDTAPASRQQVNNIGASSGGSVNIANEADNIGSAIKSVTFVGVETTGDNSSVNAEDATYHQIDDTGNAIDIVYQFDVGGSRVATNVVWVGRMVGTNDVITVQAYNGSGWDTIRTITGQSNSAPTVTADNTSIEIPLLLTYTGTGSDLGKVFIRFVCSGQSNPTLYTDQLLVSAVNIGQTVGYDGGYIYFNSNASNTNSEAYVDGVADNPVSSWAAVIALQSSTELTKLNVVGTLTPTSSMEIFNTVETHRAVLDFTNNVSCGDVEFINAKSVYGQIHTSDGSRPVFTNCIIAKDTLPLTTTPINCKGSEIGASGIIASSGGNWDFDYCSSSVAGGTYPTVDFSDTDNNNIAFTDWKRGLGLVGLLSNDVITANGDFNTLYIEGSGAEVNVAGQFGTLNTDNMVDDSNVSINNAFDKRAIAGYFPASIYVDEANGTSTGVRPRIDGTFTNPSNDFDNGQTIATTLGTPFITNIPGNSITLSQALQGFQISNIQSTINGGAQFVDSTRFEGGFLTGQFRRQGTGLPTAFTCSMQNVTTDRMGILGGCGIVGTLTISEAGIYPIVDAQAAGAGTSTVDCSGLGCTLNFERWAGNIIFDNVGSSTTINMHSVAGGDVVINGSGGTLAFTGIYGDITDNRDPGSTAITNKAITLANLDEDKVEVIASGMQYWTTGAGGGGGGDATAANQTTIINHLTDIKGSGYSIVDHSLVAIDSDIDSAMLQLTAIENGVDNNFDEIQEVQGYVLWNSGEIAKVLIDTNELQQDWTDGGRLDSILDNIEALSIYASGNTAADVWNYASRTVTLQNGVVHGGPSAHLNLSTIDVSGSVSSPSVLITSRSSARPAVHIRNPNIFGTAIKIFTGTGAEVTTLGASYQINNNTTGDNTVIESDIQNILEDTSTTIPVSINNVSEIVAWTSGNLGAGGTTPSGVWNYAARTLTAPTNLTDNDQVFSNTSVSAILEDTSLSIPSGLDQIKGAGFVELTDSLEAIRNQGDSAWVTGSGGTISASQIWGALITDYQAYGTFGSGLGFMSVWFEEMTEDSFGTRRYTTDALANGPGGGGSVYTYDGP